VDFTFKITICQVIFTKSKVPFIQAIDFAVEVMFRNQSLARKMANDGHCATRLRRWTIYKARFFGFAARGCAMDANPDCLQTFGD
jgi:hypothetical protein